jgi:hypothetical protein
LKRRHHSNTQVFLFGGFLQNPVVTGAEEVGSRRFRAGQVQGVEGPKSSFLQFLAAIPYRVFQCNKLRRDFEDGLDERPAFRL